MSVINILAWQFEQTSIIQNPIQRFIVPNVVVVVVFVEDIEHVGGIFT